MKIIFGLGNPGIKYALNYHNLGFMALDVFADKYNININRKAKNGVYGEFMCGGEKILLVKPQTYMNSSGECVKAYVDFFKCPLSDILVVYDDIDIDKGQMRYRPHGSSGTHNGMRSITQCLGSQEFARLRIGAKNTDNRIALIDYVLMNIPMDEKPLFSPVFARASDCIKEFINGKTGEQLMCEFNKTI